MAKHLEDWNLVYQTPFWHFLEKDTWFSLILATRRGGAGALVVDKRGQVVLVNVRRRPLNGVFAEIPRGGLDLGETGVEAGLREAREETGLNVSNARVFDLGAFYPDSGILAYEMSLALVLLDDVFPEVIPIDKNEVEGCEIWSWQDLLDAVAEGTIKDSATNIAVLRAQHKYGREIQERLS